MSNLACIIGCIFFIKVLFQILMEGRLFSNMKSCHSQRFPGHCWAMKRSEGFLPQTFRINVAKAQETTTPKIRFIVFLFFLVGFGLNQRNTWNCFAYQRPMQTTKWAAMENAKALHHPSVVSDPKLGHTWPSSSTCLLEWQDLHPYYWNQVLFEKETLKLQTSSEASWRVLGFPGFSTSVVNVSLQSPCSASSREYHKVQSRLAVAAEYNSPQNPVKYLSPNNCVSTLRLCYQLFYCSGVHTHWRDHLWVRIAWTSDPLPKFAELFSKSSIRSLYDASSAGGACFAADRSAMSKSTQIRHGVKVSFIKNKLYSLTP